MPLASPVNDKSVLFYKCDESLYPKINTRLEFACPGANIVFAESCVGGPAVAVVESVAYAQEVIAESPSTRVVLVMEPNPDPSEAIKEGIAVAAAGVTNYVSERDAELLVTQITEAFQKPRNFNIIYKQVSAEQMLDIKGDRVEIEGFKNNFIIGTSEATQSMVHDLYFATRLGKGKTPVHAYGPSGSGKELVFKTLADNWDIPTNRVTAYDIAAKKPELVEAELFGHTANAFTDAKKEKDGLFSKYANGFIFLDEIDKTTKSVQGSLLRVLSSGKFSKMGSLEQEIFSGQIMTAASIPIPVLIEEDRFISDLFGRINGYTVIVPSLSERKDDIPLLVTYKINELNKANPEQAKGIEKNAIEALQAWYYRWEVRELMTAVEKAYNYAGTTITISNVEQGLKQSSLLNDAALSYKRPLTAEQLKSEYTKAHSKIQQLKNELAQ